MVASGELAKKSKPLSMVGISCIKRDGLTHPQCHQQIAELSGDAPIMRVVQASDFCDNQLIAFGDLQEDVSGTRKD